MLFMDDLFDRQVYLGELFFQPLKDDHHRGILFAQSLRELRHERATKRFAFRHAGSQQRQHFVRLAMR